MGQMSLTPARSSAVITIAPEGTPMRWMRPQATWLRTKRTHLAAGRSPVKRPSPLTRVASSTRLSERPIQAELMSRFTESPSGPPAAAHLARRAAHGLDDVLVPGAAAQVRRDQIEDLVLRYVRI